VKLTSRMERLLLAFLDEPATARYALELSKLTGMVAPSVYTTLYRLKDEGLVTAEQEPSVPKGETRPPRTYYRLTEEGIRAARGVRDAPAHLDWQAWYLAQARDHRRQRR
jgi:PadR family transcriptional regulator, regulatory protein PadR